MRSAHSGRLSRASFALATAFVLPLALYACSDDSDSNAPNPQKDGSAEASSQDSGGTDGGTDANTGTDTGTDAAPDQNAPTGLRCTQAEFDQVASTPIGGDYTGFPGADISFPTLSSPAQYSPRCVKVKKDAVVTFAGSFKFHPLAPSGGDTPSPIPTQDKDTTNNTLAVTMSTVGTYGFECTFHPTTMFGAIQVVP